MGPDMSYSTSHLWPYRRFNSKRKSYTGEGLQYVDCIGLRLVDDYFTYRAVAAYLIFPDSPACLGWYGCKKWTYTTWCLVQFGPRCPANHQIGAYWTVMREVMWLMLLETWFGGNEDGEHQSQLIQICFLVCVSSTLMLSALYWLYVSVLILSTGRHYFFFLSSHTLLTSLTLFQLTDKQSIPPQS